MTTLRCQAAGVPASCSSSSSRLLAWILFLRDRTLHRGIAGRCAPPVGIRPPSGLRKPRRLLGTNRPYWRQYLGLPGRHRQGRLRLLVQSAATGLRHHLSGGGGDGVGGDRSGRDRLDADRNSDRDVRRPATHTHGAMSLGRRVRHPRDVDSDLLGGTDDVVLRSPTSRPRESCSGGNVLPVGTRLFPIDGYVGFFENPMQWALPPRSPVARLLDDVRRHLRALHAHDDAGTAVGGLRPNGAIEGDANQPTARAPHRTQRGAGHRPCCSASTSASPSAGRCSSSRCSTSPGSDTRGSMRSRRWTIRSSPVSSPLRRSQPSPRTPAVDLLHGFLDPRTRLRRGRVTSGRSGRPEARRSYDRNHSTSQPHHQHLTRHEEKHHVSPDHHCVSAEGRADREPQSASSSLHHCW